MAESQRPGYRPRRVRPALQRGIDVLSEYADAAAQKLSAVSDPRARLLRKRRWALRLGVFFSFATAFWVFVTGLLAVWSTPVWALLITGLIAAGAAVPATLWLLRYRWLRGEPLPPRRQVSGHRLPPPGSAARPAMSALAASERGLHSLLGVLQRGRMLPEEEIRELTAAAGRSAVAMAATAAQVVSMERTVVETADSAAYLTATIDAFTAQLNSGVRQYNDMVSAAARLVSTASTASAASAGDAQQFTPLPQQASRAELNDATDRLLGWAQAFDELGQLR